MISSAVFLCLIAEVTFKEGNPDMKIVFSKFCTLLPKRCVIAGSSGTYVVCVCTTRQNILLVDTRNLEVTYKDLDSKVVCDPSYCDCMIHRCANCPGTNALHKFLEE